jgi:hypothetical protein
MNSGRRHLPGQYVAASVPSQVRICMAKVADAFLAEGVSYKRQREIYLDPGYEIS